MSAAVSEAGQRVANCFPFFEGSHQLYDPRDWQKVAVSSALQSTAVKVCRKNLAVGGASKGQGRLRDVVIYSVKFSDLERDVMNAAEEGARQIELTNEVKNRWQDLSDPRILKMVVLYEQRHAEFKQSNQEDAEKSDCLRKNLMDAAFALSIYAISSYGRSVVMDPKEPSFLDLVLGEEGNFPFCFFSGFETYRVLKEKTEEPEKFYFDESREWGWRQLNNALYHRACLLFDPSQLAERTKNTKFAQLFKEDPDIDFDGEFDDAVSEPVTQEGLSVLTLDLNTDIFPPTAKLSNVVKNALLTAEYMLSKEEKLVAYMFSLRRPEEVFQPLFQRIAFYQALLQRCDQRFARKLKELGQANTWMDDSGATTLADQRMRVAFATAYLTLREMPRDKLALERIYGREFSFSELLAPECYSSYTIYGFLSLCEELKSLYDDQSRFPEEWKRLEDAIRGYLKYYVPEDEPQSASKGDTPRELVDEELPV